VSSHLYNPLYISMETYGFIELLVRANPQIIFHSEKYYIDRVNFSRLIHNSDLPRLFKEALQEAYAKMKLEKMGVTSRGELKKGLTYQKLIKIAESREWKKKETLYMKLGLLEGKGLKNFNGHAKSNMVKVPRYSLILAVLGRVYYSIIHPERERVAYLTLIPSAGADLDLALHVRGLITRFEAEFEKTIFMKRFGEVPDIAKPFVLSLFLDQNILTLAYMRWRTYPLSLSWVVLEGGRNFRQNVMLPLEKNVNITVALREYQKPVKDLIRSLIAYRSKDKTLPRESIELLSRIVYAFMNKDVDALAGVNLEVLKMRDVEQSEDLKPLTHRELMGVCRVIEGL